jgi:hypothetical protein
MIRKQEVNHDWSKNQYLNLDRSSNYIYVFYALTHLKKLKISSIFILFSRENKLQETNGEVSRASLIPVPQLSGKFETSLIPTCGKKKDIKL